MKTIIINNKIQLVRDAELVEMSLLVPARNLQAMQEKINCRIISKNPAVVDFRHNAGQLYRVRLKVRYNAIAPYLNACNYDVAINAEIFASLFYSSQNYCSILRDSACLYAFGDCSSINDKGVFKTVNVIYYNQNNKISLVANERNDYGDKRYIKFKNQWYSNRKF